MSFLLITYMESLDPRVNRLNLSTTELTSKAPLDQLGTYEVFSQLREAKPYFHVGPVHAPNCEMAFLFAKEQFSRRQTCTGLFVVETRNIKVSIFTEGEDTVYNYIEDFLGEPKGGNESYELFHLKKRGKQHEHIGTIEASSAEEALSMVKPEFINDKPVYNLWIIKTADIEFSQNEDKIIWDTLPDKKFRDAIAYKAADKIKEFKERQS
ncbi:MAG: phenylacetic acid degradation b [Bacteroidota bacterium]